MKFSIKYLDEVSLEFTLGRGPSGRWDVGGVFAVFLGRPGRPHLSLFTKPNGSKYTPHLTAWNGEDRYWLPKFSPEAAARWTEVVGATVYAEYVKSLERVDLTQLDQAGWTVHWVDWRVLARWLRPRCLPGSTLAITADVADSLCFHTMRHVVLPRHLADVRDPRCFMLLRWKADSDDEPEVRMLFHYPDGVPLPRPDGSVQIVCEPGWYSNSVGWNTPVSEQLIVGTRLEQAFLKIRQFVERYPRRSRSAQRRPELREFSGFVVGYCATELIRISLAFVVELSE